MGNYSKADQIGEVLQAMAYHELEVLGETVHILDYAPGPLADNKRIVAAAEQQAEQHLLLHHGLPTDNSETEIQDDWCLECTKQLLTQQFGSWGSALFEQIGQLGEWKKVCKKETVLALVMHFLQFLDEGQERQMRNATEAVGMRERLQQGDPEACEALIKKWDHDHDRVTDYYAILIGSRFSRMVDRAEKLNAIPARVRVPDAVQVYLTEASRCYVFGQFVACLVVCRAAIEFTLGDCLIRNGKREELESLEIKGEDGLAARM